jgi:hypothetical protein
MTVATIRLPRYHRRSMQGNRYRRRLRHAAPASIKVLGPSDLVAEAEKLAQRRPAQFRQFYLAMRAINRIDDGEDHRAVASQVSPMLESGDGTLS